MMASQRQETLPLARRYALRELPGWWAKYLVVPPGRIGVALDRRGRARTWPEPGRHRVLSAWERLRGQGIGLRTGWVPGQPFEVRVQVPYLLTGDGRLVNAYLVVRARVSDPALFFRRWVVPAGELHQLSLSLDAPEARSALSEETGQYAAEDLIRGLPREASLHEALRRRLRVLLEPEGLAVEGIPLMLFGDAEKRIQIAEKWLELRERLQALEMEEKMAAIEQQAEQQGRLEEFVRELEQDLGLKVHLAGPESAPQATKQNLWDALRALVRGEEVRHPLLKRLLEKEKAPEPPVPRVPRWWWVPRVAFVAVVWLLALVLTRIIFWWRGAQALTEAPGELIALWFFVLLLTLESVKALYEKRERLAEASWALRGYTRVDDLARQDRTLADRLVREQSAAMLRTLRESLNRLRSQVYREGHTELALRVRSLEREAEHLAEEVLRPDFGRPPYVDDTLRIDKTSWDAMLDDDEELLIQLHKMLERMRRLQQHFNEQKPWLDDLQDLERALADFRLQFSRRSAALRPRRLE